MNNFFIAILCVTMALTVLPYPVISMMLRIIMLVSVFPGMSYLKYGIRKQEFYWIVLTALYLAGTMISALCAQNILDSFLDFFRQVYVVIFSVLLTFCLRESKSRIIFIYGMGLIAVLDIFVICYLYIKDFGTYIPHIYNMKFFKTTVADIYNINFNPISFSLLIAVILSYPLWPIKTLSKNILITFIIIMLILTGSEATIISFIIGFVVYGCICHVNRNIGFSALFAVAIASLCLLFYDNIPISFDMLSNITTGRLDLWVAGVAKFIESPLVGWGANSWKVDLRKYLPIYDIVRFENLQELEGGGFHNSYLTLLAEKGLVTFIPGLLMLMYLIRQSLKLFAGRHLLTWPDSKLAQIAPLLMITMSIRYLGEQGGLFGFGNGAVDFLSYSVASLQVAISAELDNKQSM